jgi:hypothetical protein
MRFIESFSISRVDNYDVFCYSNKSAIVSKAKEIMQHLYGVQSLVNGHQQPAANTSSADLCSIATIATDIVK